LARASQPLPRGAPPAEATGRTLGAPPETTTPTRAFRARERCITAVLLLDWKEEEEEGDSKKKKKVRVLVWPLWLGFFLLFWFFLCRALSNATFSIESRPIAPLSSLSEASYAPHGLPLHGARAKDPHEGSLCGLNDKVFLCVFCFVALLFLLLPNCDRASPRVLFSPDARLTGKEEARADPS